MQGLGIVPDAAHSNWEFPEGIGVGELQNPSDSVSDLLKPLKIKIRVQARIPSIAPYLESIKRGSTDNQKKEEFGKYTWDASLRKVEGAPLLYVFLHPGEVDRISKTALMNLLDFAEDILHCNHVIFCLELDQSLDACDIQLEENRSSEDSSEDSIVEPPSSCNEDSLPMRKCGMMCHALETLMFVGFQQLAPEDDYSYPTPDYLSLICDV